ncbi:hypothetical protein CsSME_00047629 [Camellia sinensis var. sinensis]
MGSLVGHVAPGFGFFVIGLWHLLNHIKLHAVNPNYTSLPWFPTSKLRYLELFLIMGDGTIPSNHLHNFEHSSISMTFFVYASFAIILDRMGPKAQYGLTQLLGQYHLLLQSVILVSLVTTLMGIRNPKSFLISFVRSLSILFQGVWLMFMGFMLWTPAFMPKGCYLNLEEGHKVVRCHSHEALERAKSLVNLQFSWFLILVTVCAMCLYLFLIKIYGHKVEYNSLLKYEERDLEEDEDEDVEAQKKSKLGESKSFVHL